MGLWVLEPKSGEKVPGTVYVEAVDETARVKTAHFKTGRGRHADIILVPQPSQSPNDPLSMIASLAYLLILTRSRLA